MGLLDRARRTMDTSKRWVGLLREAVHDTREPPDVADLPPEIRDFALRLAGHVAEKGWDLEELRTLVGGQK